MNIFLKVVGSRVLTRALLRIAEVLSKRTDSTLDDTFVDILKQLTQDDLK